MKRTLLFAALAAASFFGTGVAGAASFTYHGNLQDAGKPADGKYDIELTLYSAKTGGSVIGGPLTLYSVPVRDGSFSTDADFGPLAKAFSQAYVGVKVRTAGTGTFAPLDDLAPVTPDTNTSCPGSWSLDGNAGNPSGSYLGTGDTQPLILKTDAAQVVISDLGDGGTVPRWIGGGSLNNSTAGEGAFIGGGGSNTAARNKNSIGAFGVVTGGAGNSASGTTTDISGGITGYATVGGGQFNKASGYAATVAGGGGTTGSGGTTTTGNNASARGATIGGGQNNLASGVWATVAGGYGNVASGISATVAGGGDPGTECNINESKPCGNSASGNYSAVAGGEGNVALGNYSFAAGINSYAGGCQSVAMGTNSLVRDGAMAGVNCGDAGTFVWSGQYGGMESSGDDQFLVLAIGGVGINTTPVNSDVELTIMATPGGNSDYANVFMRQQSMPAGILFSAGQATSGANNSQFFIDQFDGTNQARRLTIGATGDLTVSANAFKPGGGSWTATSDRRIKQDIAPIQDALDTIMKLRPVNFRYTPEYRAMEGGLADRSYAGFIAQEYADVFPTDVISTSEHLPGAAKNDPTILALDPNPALITTVAAVQELAVENAALHKQIDDLEARLSKLETGKGQ